MFDPFARGRFSVGVRTVEAYDTARNQRFQCEIWYPAEASHFGQDYAAQTLDIIALPGTSAETRTQEAVRDAAPASGSHPLVVYSHGTGRWHRRSATFLCTHLASHGYVVAALDHYEVLAPKPSVTELGKNRVADVTFILDSMLSGAVAGDIRIEPSRVSAVGYSLGGWTVLSALESESRIRAVVALAPAGSSKPRPGVFAGKLSFKWKRELPSLYLSAEDDVMTPPSAIAELFKRAPAPKRAFTLRKADHMHFIDGVEEEHEIVRTTVWPEQLAWISTEMRPAGELSSGEQAHAFTCGLTLAHLDANLQWKEEARNWLSGNVQMQLAGHGIDAYESGRAMR